MRNFHLLNIQISVKSIDAYLFHIRLLRRFHVITVKSRSER